MARLLLPTGLNLSTLTPLAAHFLSDGLPGGRDKREAPEATEQPAAGEEPAAEEEPKEREDIEDAPREIFKW